MYTFPSLFQINALLQTLLEEKERSSDIEEEKDKVAAAKGKNEITKSIIALQSITPIRG